MTCLADLSLRRLWSSSSITMREPVTWRRKMVKWSTWNIHWIYRGPLQKGIHPLCCWLLPLIKWSKNHSYTGKKRVIWGTLLVHVPVSRGTSGTINTVNVIPFYCRPVIQVYVVCSTSWYIGSLLGTLPIPMDGSWNSLITIDIDRPRFYMDLHWGPCCNSAPKI